jgi:predicted nuclease of predicted toxin-antitoxin system
VELGQSDDAEILQKARAEGSVLLTHDLDFGDLLAASGESLPSVVTFRLRNMKPDKVIERLTWILSNCERALRHGSIVTVTESHARVHPLPIRRRE